ncbi:hypothetical protein LTR36_005463 [Oleoguttula mirabilis]|uniref:Uncharacterized protein n=1 Tax=Oleoguttula mirabilis TaxID=1507867 RepID=A0AAV9JF87_9PEZI|nr:hypothetical protein LTR36_005463 [Oleoguttula mirabilis]
MSYDVYTAEYQGTTINHVAIFVKTNSDGNGRIFHVTGSVMMGMKYETRDGKSPKDSHSFVPGSLNRIGAVEQSNMSQFEAACEAVEVPGKQYATLNKRIDPSKPLRRCTHWVEDVVAKLLADGIVI